MKIKCLLLAFILTNTLALSYAKAQDDESFTDDEESTIMPSSSSSTPPVMIDESDAGDVSDVEEYDG